MALFKKNQSSGHPTQTCPSCSQSFSTALFAHAQEAHVVDSSLDPDMPFMWMCQKCSTEDDPVGAICENKLQAAAAFSMHVSETHGLTL